MEIIDAVKELPYGDIGFSGLVMLAIILIYKGQIVPKSTVDEMRNDRDAAILRLKEEVENWQEAYKLSETARLTGSESADKELLELGRTTVHLLTSIQEKAIEARLGRKP